MNGERKIVTQTSGNRHGPITRLMSPGDLGELLKPFIFLDYLEANGNGPQFGFHPHSGIATLTFPMSFDMEHTTSQGQVDIVGKGGVEWVVTGHGIWHKARTLNSTHIQGFQTWFALPPSHELSAPSAKFLAPEDVPRSGPVTVLLGQYENMASKIDAPFDATYLWVQLEAGESWTYQPAASHNTAWTFSQSGTLNVSGARLVRELAVFEEGNAPIVFNAAEKCSFLVASAAKLPQSLSLGNYSVHSSPERLIAGEQRIREIGATIRS